MDPRAALESQLLSIRVFRPFFPWTRLVLDALRFPFDYLGDGRARPFPAVVNLNVTNRCNYGCACCYNVDNDRRSAELTLAEYGRLVDECARHGTGLFLSGGEPTLRREHLDMIRMAHGRGLATGIVTNGTGFEAGTRAHLDAGLDSVIVSVRGTAEVHDATVHRRGAYARTMAAVRELAAVMPAPGPVVNYVVTAESAGCARAFVDEALRIPNLVVRLTHLSFATAAEAAVHDAAWTARVGGPPPPFLTFRHEVDPERFADVPALMAGRHPSRLLSKPHLTPAEAAAWYAPGFRWRRRCLFVWHSTHINADGTVLPCQYYAYPMGNLREEPLERIWNGERYRAFRRTLRDGLLPGCMRCCKL